MFRVAETFVREASQKKEAFLLKKKRRKNSSPPQEVVMPLSDASTVSSRPFSTVFQETMYHSMCTIYLADFRTEPVILRWPPTSEVEIVYEGFSLVLCLTDLTFVLLDLLMQHRASFCRQWSSVIRHLS
jgi:hypothetical protein